MPPKVLPPFRRGTRKGGGTTTFKNPSAKGISECRMTGRVAHERRVWAEYKPYANSQVVGPQPSQKSFGIGCAMRMRTNMQGLMTASVSMSDWICTEGHDLHTGHFSQPTAAMRGYTQALTIPQQSCSHGCCSSHPSAVHQPCISKTVTLICSFPCSALENNLVFFQIPDNSLTR